MNQPTIPEPMTESYTYKDHVFEIVTKRGEMGEYLRFHNVVEISVDGLQIIFQTDMYADFDNKGGLPKIDLAHYDTHLPGGWISLDTLIKWKEAK